MSVSGQVPNRSLERSLQEDERFAIVSRDGRHWICPYDGQAVLITQDVPTTARAYCYARPELRQQEALTRSSLVWHRWRCDLRQWLPREPRLQIFTPAGVWLNPFDGVFDDQVVRHGSRIDEPLIDAMAWALVGSAAAERGELLPHAELARRMQGLTRRITARGSADDLRRDLAKAGQVQRRLFGDLPTVEGYAFAAHNAPHAEVTGDFYDILPWGEGRYFVCFGDVSGHGLQAGLVVASALKSLRHLVRQYHQLRPLVRALNDDLRADLERGQFLTLFAGILDTRAHQLTCVLAGHHPLLMAAPDQTVLLQQVGRAGTAIGLVDGARFEKSLHPVTVPVPPGAVLLQYSDALEEAHDAGQNQFGLVQLGARFLRYSQRGAKAIVDELARAVQRHATGLMEDDLTMLIIRRSG